MSVEYGSAKYEKGYFIIEKKNIWKNLVDNNILPLGHFLSSALLKRVKWC